MKQILQSLADGKTEVAELPVPASRRGHLLIRSAVSLVSTGTERMLVEFGRAGWIEKAKQQPEKVKAVLDKVRTDGLLATLDAVRGKLDQPLPLGYCNVGTVVDLGTGVANFTVGDRVVSNGRHAEVVAVPANLCARVPDGVSNESAAFTVLGAIALQGIRLVQPTLGESVVVTGLGLIGLLAVQLLRANGCRVLGIDFDPAKLAIAAAYGADVVNPSAGGDPLAAAEAFSRGRGVDAVLITASTTSNEPLRQAAHMCRKRGRIVLVGVAGLELERSDFYEKELTFQVSCSYGPGRYDPSYEERGVDYPIGFVRWTEQRNFEAVLDMMFESRLTTTNLVTHRFAVADAPAAYDTIVGGGPSLGVLIEYPTAAVPASIGGHERTLVVRPRPQGRTDPGVAFIGAGNYATAVLAPAFVAAGARLLTVATANGVSGVHAARKFGFAATTTDAGAVFDDPDVAAVVVSTRHDTHADFVCRAFAAGKHVFVEKPLALTLEELAAIEAARTAARQQGHEPLLMVGFNRRFSPLVRQLQRLLEACPGPRAMTMTINAGRIPAGHWTQDSETGGGRIVGEACHFVDLMRCLAGSPLTAATLQRMASPTRDTAVITLGFANGSIGAVNYLANGSKAYPKERLEVFADGRVAVIDNFRSLCGYGWPGFRRQRLWRQDKGQRECARGFVKAVTEGGACPIPYEQVMEIAAAMIRLDAEGRA